MPKEKTKKDQKKSGKDHPVMCTLINRPCIHADPHLADTGVYESCRLCDVYQEVVHPPRIIIWK